MQSVKFIHTGDLHLDSPFRGLSSLNNELASRLKDATLKSFRRIIDLCVSEQVDFLLISGDIFDSEMKSLAAQLRLVKALEKLNDSGIPAYIIAGNHDPFNSWIKELKMPERVYMFGSDTVECFTFEKEGERLADIYGISYATRDEQRDLAHAFVLRDNPAAFSLALLHGTVGAAGPHDNYVPFGVDDVMRKGFDYWALGHIHKHRVVNPAYPAVVYPGNPQGRDFGETGLRGCYLVEINDRNAPQMQFIPTQRIRFEEVVVDLTGMVNINLIPDAIHKAVEELAGYSSGESIIVRVTLQGRTPLHPLLNSPGETQGLVQLLNERQLQQEYFTWVDRILLNTLPDADLEELKKGTDFTAELLKNFDALNNQPGLYDELLASVEQSFNSQAARRELGELSGDEKKEILQKAQWMLIDQLLKEQV